MSEGQSGRVVADWGAAERTHDVALCPGSAGGKCHPTQSEKGTIRHSDTERQADREIRSHLSVPSRGVAKTVRKAKSFSFKVGYYQPRNGERTEEEEAFSLSPFVDTLVRQGPFLNPVESGIGRSVGT